MRLTQLTLCNFRCFGTDAQAAPTVVELADFTAFIGSNGAGKTAIMQALVRLFGERPSDRRITKSDFHIPPHTELGQGPAARQLWIEARLEFPGLTGVGHTAGVPEYFRQMLVGGPGQVPFCRVRLEATWTQSGYSEGEVDERLWWVTDAVVQSDGASPLPEDVKTPMLNSDRSAIQVLYVPAIRDPAAQLRVAAGALLQPLLRAIPWSDAARQQASTAAQQVQDAINGEPGMQQLQQAIEREWRQLQDFEPLQHVLLQPINADFDSLLRYMSAVFRTCEGAHLQPIECLSDGLRSLFYFAMLGARFELERAAVQRIGAAAGGSGLALDGTSLPLLTLFAIEEPENHLAPHYLSHIIGLLRRQQINERVQVLLTSQSPAILSRIEPEEVRHVQHDYRSCTVRVRRLSLPSNQGEAYKYVKEAVRAYPELYFAKAVVLGEGDSEAVVLPRVARQLGLALEEQLISFVPLGGRHVHHLWRLLHELRIPHVTLLDLDWERHGGGWRRIHYAIAQLLAFHQPRLALASFGLTEETFQRLGQSSPLDTGVRNQWLSALEQYGVYFSAPLDLDFLLLQAFPQVYQQPNDGGTGPDNEGAPERIEQATRTVLKPRGGDGSTYSEAERRAFVWYQYLFLGRGKPVTHMLAFAALEAQGGFQGQVPGVLQRLLRQVTHTQAPAQ